MMRNGAVSHSDLKAMELSAAHYAHAVICPREVTRAMRMGTLVDMLLLTDKKPLVSALIRNSNDYKSLRASVPSEVEIFSKTEHEEALEIVTVTRRDPIARDFLGLDDPERRTQVPLEWVTLGVPRRTRGVDVITKKRLVDLKLTNSTKPDRFGWHARGRYWHAQLADYVDACQQNEIDISGGAYLLGIESTAPYPVTALHVTESALLEGAKLVRKWIEAYRACELAGVWPGYVQSPQELTVFDSDAIVVGSEGADEEDDAA